jgi:hypothetical protein
VAAEFAVAMPAVLACLVLCLGAVQGASQYAGLSGAAAVAARLAGRGDDPGAAHAPAGAEMAVEHEGGLVCVTMSGGDGVGLSRLGIRLSARACALDEGSTGSTDR